MLGNFRFDDMVEKLSRRVAGRTSRRGVIGRIGAVMAGGALIPLLPVDRRGRVSRAHAATAPEGSDPRAKWQPQDTDIQSCDYWRHFSIDGNICDCSGGSLNNCPPGTKLATASWVASCYNPTDGESYLIAYRDCCGKPLCQQCFCDNTDRETQIYTPQLNNDIIWCFGTGAFAFGGGAGAGGCVGATASPATCGLESVIPPVGSVWAMSFRV